MIRTNNIWGSIVGPSYFGELPNPITSLSMKRNLHPDPGSVRGRMGPWWTEWWSCPGFQLQPRNIRALQAGHVDNLLLLLLLLLLLTIPLIIRTISRHLNIPSAVRMVELEEAVLGHQKDILESLEPWGY